jgi:ABC-type antimicrobial peptide transport system permease subunit
MEKIRSFLDRDALLSVLIIVACSLSFFLLIMGTTSVSAMKYQYEQSIDENGVYIPDSVLSGSEVENYQDYLNINIYVNIGIIIFTTINCIFVTQVWIIRRYDEFAVRKAFGQKNLQIIWEIFRDLLVHAIISVIIGGIIYLLYALIRKGNACAVSRLAVDLVKSAILLLAVLIISVLASVKKILRLSPVKLISERNY